MRSMLEADYSHDEGQKAQDRSSLSCCERASAGRTQMMFIFEQLDFYGSCGFYLDVGE